MSEVRVTWALFTLGDQVVGLDNHLVNRAHAPHITTIAGSCYMVPTPELVYILYTSIYRVHRVCLRDHIITYGIHT